MNELGSFTLGGGGDLPQLAMPNTHIFHFQNHETHFGRCPMLPSPPLNTKHNVYQLCTHDIPSNTKHSVDLYHALTPMSCDVLLQNVMYSCHWSFIQCYIYDECYMCMPTVTPQIPGCLVDNPSTYGIPMSHIMRPIHE